MDSPDRIVYMVMYNGEIFGVFDNVPSAKDYLRIAGVIGLSVVPIKYIYAAKFIPLLMPDARIDISEEPQHNQTLEQVYVDNEYQHYRQYAI